jgi:hypothetical protein
VRLEEVDVDDAVDWPRLVCASGVCHEGETRFQDKHVTLLGETTAR